MKALPVRWSALRHIRRSPAHYRYFLEHGTPITAAMRFGSLVDRVYRGSGDFAVYEGYRRGKAWDDFQALHPNVEIVTTEEYRQALAAVDSIKACKVATQMLDGDSQPHYTWTIGGRECEGTPDYVNEEWLADLKVTADANPERFHWHSAKMGWFAQMAWYLDGIDEAEMLPPPSRVGIVAVESKPPYVVVPYELTPRAMDFGRRQWRLAWEQLLICEANNSWPGYIIDGPHPLEPIEDVTLEIDGEEVEL